MMKQYFTSRENLFQGKIQLYVLYIFSILFTLLIAVYLLFYFQLLILAK